MVGSERRRWGRYACEEQAAMPLLRIATSPAADDAINTFAKDISLGGCSFELDRATNLSHPMPLIKVFLPGGLGTLELEGRIAWQRPGEKGMCSGVAFPGLSESEQQLLHDFFQRVASDLVPTDREQAIVQLERGVLRYRQGQFAQAKREFQHVIREFAGLIDVARVARRYHDWCNEEQEG
ncbi:MAG: PilZ domain-containing protein [Candidatus Omnitrophica bacterium]|nr:PilZ domain-containing protein [Candidatus Omnitrophota bacterium]